MMIIYSFLLECLFTMTLVNSLSQIADLSGSLHLDDPGNMFALMSDDPTDDDQTVDSSSTLSGKMPSLV